MPKHSFFVSGMPRGSRSLATTTPLRLQPFKLSPWLAESSEAWGAPWTPETCSGLSTATRSKPARRRRTP